MIRTQIQFREEQYERIRTMAHRRRISISEAVRRLVDAAMQGDDPGIDDGIGLLLSLAGTGRSGKGDVALRHDDYLDEDMD